MRIKFTLKAETKTCYRFQNGEDRSPDMITLYLKKSQVDAAGIDPKKGIVVTIEQAVKTDV